jgi:hypothetical protein
VISTLPDDKESFLFYGCETELRNHSVNMLDIPPISTTEATDILTSMLLEHSRTLHQSQWDYVLEKFAVEPNFLYLQLVARVVKHWKYCPPSSYLLTANSKGKSSNSMKYRLEGGVKPLFNQILEELEATYGTLLTCTALGLLSYSVNGLRDVEMVDLLTFDDEIFRNVKECANPNIRRMPSCNSVLNLFDSIANKVILMC